MTATRGTICECEESAGSWTLGCDVGCACRCHSLEAKNAHLQSELNGTRAQLAGTGRALAEVMAEHSAARDENTQLIEVCVQRLARIMALEKELMARRENEMRLRDALVALTVSGEWLAFGNLPERDIEPMPISEALNLAHAALSDETIQPLKKPTDMDWHLEPDEVDP